MICWQLIVKVKQTEVDTVVGKICKGSASMQIGYENNQVVTDGRVHIAILPHWWRNKEHTTFREQMRYLMQRRCQLAIKSIGVQQLSCFSPLNDDGAI